jgi:hypothetical protein
LVAQDGSAGEHADDKTFGAAFEQLCKRPYVVHSIIDPEPESP